MKKYVGVFIFVSSIFGLFVSLPLAKADCPQSVRDGLIEFSSICSNYPPYGCPGQGEGGVIVPYEVRTARDNFDPNILVSTCGLQCPGRSWLPFAEHRYPGSCSASFIGRPVNSAIDTPTCHSGSVINVNNLTLGEVIPIAGTSFSLMYSSNFVQGRKDSYSFRIDLTGDEVPLTVTGYSVEISRQNGSILQSQGFANSQNQVFLYKWDGLDDNGNSSWGPINLKTKVIEFGTDGNIQHVDTVSVGELKAVNLGLGGWVPSSWLFYSPVDKRLYSSDGTSRVVEAVLDGVFWRVPSIGGDFVHYFDSVGRIVHTKTGLTGVTIRSFTYESNGYLASVEELFGRATTFHRNLIGILTSIEAPNGKVTGISINGDGYLASVTNPLAEPYSMTYSSEGLLATFAKPNSAVSTFIYDVSGNLQSDIHTGGAGLSLAKSSNIITLLTSLGRSSTIETTVHNSSSFQEEYTYPDGGRRFRSHSSSLIVDDDRTAEVRLNFDQHSRFGVSARRYTRISLPVIGERSISLSETVNSLDPDDPFTFASLEVTATNGPGRSIETYISATKTFSQESKLGRTFTRVIDGYERPLSEQVGNQNSVLYAYTAENLTGLTQGSRATSFAYHPTTKYLASVTNALGQMTGFTYNSAGRLTSKILPDTRSIAYQYDSVGNLVSLTPPSRPAHTWSIGAHEMVTSYSPPGLGLATVSTSYAYNLDKQLTQVTRPDSQTIIYNHHPTTGVLNSIVTPAGTTAFGYTSGLLDQIESPNQWRVSLGYYTGVPTSLHLYEPSMPWVALISYYAFDGNHFGTIGSESLSDKVSTKTTSYTYDDDGGLTSTGDMTISYNIPNGQITGTTASAITDAYVYNSYGEVTAYEAKYSGATIYSYTLSRDNLGRVTEKVETLNGVTTDYDYSYDISGRLTQVEKNGSTDSTYTYDSNSNRISASIHGVSFTGIYDDQDRLTSYNTYDLGYNLNGELESKTHTLTSQVVTYVSDVFGQSTQVVLPSKTVNYEIDPMGRRLGVLWGSAVQKRYFYDLKGRLIAEFDENGEIKKRFVYATRNHIPDYYVDNISQVFRIITDQLGSVRLVVRADTGAIIQRMEHDEFGRVLQDTNPGLQPFGFAGGLYDSDTKLVRFGARDYDPETGRWTSKDPILFSGGDTNLYGYVMNDPVNLIDSKGLSARDVSTIRNSFSDLVIQMGKYGLRRPGSGYLNGVLNNLEIAVNGGDTSLRGCHGQASSVRDNLNNLSGTDDDWIFRVVPGLMGTHFSVEGHSSNPSDPVLLLDPWINGFQTRGR